ncbi:hypothetical protein SAMN04488515_2036 [Cognatiyoonia koreensis]|uniref:Uncharacterized protein n=1 Tax=Cognatiyoonia koreensis TaxID=364200 RepID=A0A1I0QN67_9RHOB|nr:hypothetical protein [Cognatiyoonia koreensis]SEW28692.1 hypothetical protein SAMN04488515_2036 [Cognatiyoonia koreensis]
MKRIFFLTSTALAAMLLTTYELAAQARNCGPHEVVTTRLAERYGESRQIIALTSDQSVMELFASPETGSWTITITRAGQPTCLVAAGQNYQHVAEALGAPDQGA